MRKILIIFLDLLLSLFLLAFAFFASYVFFLWSGYPAGGDAAQHLSRLVYVLTFPTSFNWFHVWAGGMPQFLWYPFLPYFILSEFVKLTALNPALTLNITAVAATGLSGVAIFFLVLSLTRSRLSGLVSSVLFLASPPSYILIDASVYARQLALPFVLFSLLFFIRFWKSYQEDSSSKTDFIIGVFFIGLVLVNHFAMGATLIGLLTIIGVFTSQSLKKFTIGFAKIFLPALFLSSFFWLPFLFFPIPGFLVGKDVLSRPQLTNPWSNLFYFFNKDYVWFFQPSFFILPFFLIGTLFVLGFIVYFRRKRLSLGIFEKRFLMATLILAFLSIIYAQIRFPFLASFYSNIWPVLWVLLFSVIFISISIGLLFSWSFSSVWNRLIAAIFLLTLCLGWMQTQFPVDFLPKNPFFQAPVYQVPYGTPYQRIEANRDREFYHSVAESLFSENTKEETNYRFGTANLDHMARWFNIKYPYIPQTREYFYLSVINPDSYFHLIQAVWNTLDNYEETNFLLDWWSVKKFITGVENYADNAPGKFAAKPEFYKPLGEFFYKGPLPLHQSYQAYEYLGANPILSATNTLTLLVIGKKKVAYNTLFRSLSYGNVGSKTVIPIEGSEFIDNYDINELKKFSIIFLYDYRFHDFAKANNLLNEYVEGGGLLMIEENKEVANPLSIAPIGQVVREERKGDWQFDFQNKENEVVFEPAFYDNGPWAIMTGENLKEGSQVLLTSSGKPVLIAQNLGKGKVVWSGLNLPFHTIYYHSQTESQFIASLLGIENSQNEVPNYTAKFINPQKREVEAEGARGVLFKEFYFSNWHAYEGEKEVKIYKAGPGFMYAFLADSQAKLTFVYQRSLIEKMGFVISGISLIFLLFYSLEGKIFPPLVSHFSERLWARLKGAEKKVGGWWEKEE